MTKYLVIFLILFSLGCNVNVGSNTSGHSPMAKQGPETWEINGRKMDIISTYYLALPEGLQFTTECPWKFGDPNQAMSQEETMIDAFPLTDMPMRRRCISVLQLQKLEVVLWRLHELELCYPRLQACVREVIG